MTGYPKLHKEPLKLRPVISTRNAPHSRGARHCAQVLSGYVGLISEAHIRNTRHFTEKMRRCKAKGKLLSLDIKSLYPNVPVPEAIDVVRNCTTGPNPTFKNFPVSPELFCDLLDVCMSFNQFSFAGNHYRQVSGCPIGCSLSSVLANIFLEYFETVLIDIIPVNMRPSLWLRYVDDVIICYEDMSKFEAYLEHLNGIRPTIQFTYELGTSEKVVNGQPNLPANVSECLPFLELNVMRLDNGEFAFSIYRKPCHSGNYIHAYSYQPLNLKGNVIRNMYLRAYRYCDAQFLKDEELRIQQDFLKLGYTERFIEEKKRSAFKGRMNEMKMENLKTLEELPFSEAMTTKAVKTEPLATLALPYHPCMDKLKPRLSEMGIRLAYTSNSSLKQQLRHKSSVREQPNGHVYVVNCMGCPQVYVGQTGRSIETRMREHSRGPQINAQEGAISEHNRQRGHCMDLQNPTSVLRSNDYYTRVTVEAALLHVAPTIPHNTATASIANNDIVAPLICKATRFNWRSLSECIPHLNKNAVHKHKRALFGHSTTVRPPAIPSSLIPGTPVSHRTRNRLRL